MALPTLPRPCTRCTQTSQPTHTLRQDTLCPPCLQAWILTRLSKRINDGFRILHGGRDAVRRVLLPLSGGPSSLALLHLLNVHAEGRLNRTGRVGYDVHAVWVDQSSLGVEGGFEDEGWELLKTRYSRWKISRVPIEEVFSPTGPVSDQDRESLLSSLPVSSASKTLPPSQLLSQILSSLPSPTSRTDLLSSLRTRLITSLALREECSIIIWGDTTTRLAEKTLAETAKGRGFSLPWQTSDSETPTGVKWMYPLQDLYRREIELWGKVASEPRIGDLVRSKQSLIDSASTSSKNLTIDDLMRRYFEGVEEPYPSVVANVVRTAAKLDVPNTQGFQGILARCGICDLVFDGGNGDFVGWEGNQMLEHGQEDEVGNENGRIGGVGVDGQQRRLCYACSRTMEKAKVVGPAG